MPMIDAPASRSRDGAATGPLEEQLESLGHGAHACLLYDSLESQMRAIAPFVRCGLAQRERCFYIADDRTANRALDELSRRGVDTEDGIRRDALVMLTTRDLYLHDGKFDSRSMIGFLRDTLEESLAAGFVGIRLTGEMTWALGSDVTAAELIEYEARLNQFLLGTRILGICQYDTHRFPAAVVRDVLRAHPIAVVGEEVYENLFYEPPEMMLGSVSAQERVDWMLQRLERARAIERGLARLCETERVHGSARDELMAVAAHELRTPLQALHLQLDALAELALHADVKRGIDRALGTVKRLGTLVSALFELARIESGGMTLELERTDLTALASEVVDRFAAAAAAAHCDLRFVDAGPLIVPCDPLRVEQVVAALVSNAIKYARGTRVSVRVERDGTSATLSVEDGGPGVPEAARDRIFDRFQRVGVRDRDGLGLGLYVARHIVDMHGGRIYVEQTAPTGARFVVELPT